MDEEEMVRLFCSTEIASSFLQQSVARYGKEMVKKG
jgi:hypothetical protein